MDNEIILSNLQIHTEKGMIKNGSVIVRNKKIFDIVPKNKISKKRAANAYSFPKNYHLVPGFIDLHVHGARGSDVMDATQNALETMSRALAEEGTTGFLATTMTAAPTDIEKALRNVNDFVKNQKKLSGAKLLGVHLEGPFISPKKVGAQRADLILKPNVDLVTAWQKISGNNIKLLTLAPELENSKELIRFLKRKKIIAAIGHTDATYEETLAAIKLGCSHVTHLFNAMRPLHQREPGVVAAALQSEQVTAELIADGLHVHPAILQLALTLKTPEKISLVTDAMRAKCLTDGKYELGGQIVFVKDNRVNLADGTLAGSVLKMNEALRNILQFTHCSIKDAIKMLSENPAKELNLFSRKGSIAKKKDADLVVLDDTFKVVMTVCEGAVTFCSRD